jgi:hypothetical protein
MEAELDHDAKMGLAAQAFNTGESGNLVYRRKAANGLPTSSSGPKNQ